jgi:hypothetical protein
VICATFFETTNGLVDAAGAEAFELPAEPETVALPEAPDEADADEPDEDEPEGDRPEVIEGAKPTAGAPPCE